MKINLSEIKKMDCIENTYSHILEYCLNYWYDSNVKNSLEWNTMVSYKFIKKDIVDLKEIELYDDFLFETTIKLFLKNLIYNVSDSDNMKLDINKLSTLSEEEILSLYNEDINNNTINKSVYFRSLKGYGFITPKGDINVDLLNKNHEIKKYFIINSFNMIKEFGYDWNIDIYNTLIKIGIINE